MLFAGEGRRLPSPPKKKPSSVSGGHVIIQKFTSPKRGGALHFSKHPNSFCLVFPIIPTRYHGIVFILLLFSMVLYLR
jgi:hypothetical protein